MNNKKREENKILELEKSWRVNYGACWSDLELNTEEPGF
jgi:hypothetical protein